MGILSWALFQAENEMHQDEHSALCDFSWITESDVIFNESYGTIIGTGDGNDTFVYHLLPRCNNASQKNIKIKIKKQERNKQKTKSIDG